MKTEEKKKLEKIENLLSDAFHQLEEMAIERQSYHDERSEKWQESDAGVEYEESTSVIENAKDTIEGECVELEILRE